MESFRENAIQWSKKWIARLQQHTATLASHEQLVQQGKLLCKEYVHNRLKNLGVLGGGDGATKLYNHHSDHQQDGGDSCSSDVSQELQRIGGELEKMYPDLYRNVSGQLNLNVVGAGEDSIRRAYLMFADQLFKGEVHWGKVVALFAMAGAFAEDCVQLGRPDLVGRVIDCFGAFVSRRLVGWVAKQGGWVIPDFIRDQKTETWFWLVAACGAVIGFVVTLLMTLYI